mmetsp:Transcript_1617/g.5249  ORF Transcript_1617/g.5249 Transcript_1617/m.5249 type:complete len:410 (-) Transcript_1617:867-2096(-)
MVMKPEARARGRAVGRVGERADQVARHTRDDRLAPDEKSEGDEVVQEGVKPAEPQATRRCVGEAGERARLLRQARERRPGRPPRQRQHARLARKGGAARREAEHVEPLVPKTVGAQPEESARFGPARMREALPHVGDVHIRERRRASGRPVGLFARTQRRQPDRCHHQQPAARRAAQHNTEGEPRRLARRHPRARRRRHVWRLAQRDPGQVGPQVHVGKGAELGGRAGCGERSVDGRQVKRRRPGVGKAVPVDPLLGVVDGVGHDARIAESCPQIRLSAVGGGPREDALPHVQALDEVVPRVLLPQNLAVGRLVEAEAVHLEEEPQPLPHHLAHPLGRHNVPTAMRCAAGHARRALPAGRQMDRGLVAAGGGGGQQARGVTVEVDEAAVERAGLILVARDEHVLPDHWV